MMRRQLNDSSLRTLFTKSSNVPHWIHASISFPDPAKNFTIIPDKDAYYHGETITVVVESNPEPNQIQWTHLNTDTVGIFLPQIRIV